MNLDIQIHPSCPVEPPAIVLASVEEKLSSLWLKKQSVINRIVYFQLVSHFSSKKQAGSFLSLLTLSFSLYLHNELTVDILFHLPYIKHFEGPSLR